MELWIRVENYCISATDVNVIFFFTFFPEEKPIGRRPIFLKTILLTSDLRLLYNSEHTFIGEYFGFFSSQ